MKRASTSEKQEQFLVQMAQLCILHPESVSCGRSTASLGGTITDQTERRERCDLTSRATRDPYEGEEHFRGLSWGSREKIQEITVQAGAVGQKHWELA